MTIQQTISQLANQCVLCGLCIPHCPTYGLFRTENESPRGRIFLYKALAENQIEPSKELLLSMDHCLACFACEKVCPSQVDYSQLNRLGRAFISQHYAPYKTSLKQKLIEKVLVTPTVHPALKLAAKTFSRFSSSLRTDKSKKSSYSFINHYSQEITSEPVTRAPVQKVLRTKAQVILFKGCSSDLFEQQVLEDIIVLLNACRYKVIIPQQQYCCGALGVRQGDAQTVHTMAQKNISTFVPLLKESQAIISLNNACSAHLKEYKKLLVDSEAEVFSNKTVDALSFLAYALKANKVEFSPLPENKRHIAVHIPCSLKNSLKEENYLFECLAHIPDIHLSRLNDDFCCGAAGSYMLKYPDIANQLLDKKIDEIAGKQYSTIVSSNIGCTLHFKQGLKKHPLLSKKGAGQELDVIHPIRLLARQLVINS